MPRRRKCSIVRAWVAFACGCGVVSGRSLNTTQPTPRRPSSIAATSPHGPPPTLRTGARLIIRSPPPCRRSISLDLRLADDPAPAVELALQEGRELVRAARRRHQALLRQCFAHVGQTEDLGHVLAD